MLGLKLNHVSKRGSKTIPKPEQTGKAGTATPQNTFGDNCGVQWIGWITPAEFRRNAIDSVGHLGWDPVKRLHSLVTSMPRGLVAVIWVWGWDTPYRISQAWNNTRSQPHAKVGIICPYSNDYRPMNLSIRPPCIFQSDHDLSKIAKNANCIKL